MFFHPKSLKSENNNPWIKPWFNILLHTQSIVCATVDSQCLEFLVYITLDLCFQNILASLCQPFDQEFPTSEDDRVATLDYTLLVKNFTALL